MHSFGACISRIRRSDKVNIYDMRFSYHSVNVKEGLAGMFLIVLVESVKSMDHCFEMNENAIQEKQKKYAAWYYIKE